MRVTNSMMTQHVLDNLERNATTLDKVQGQISSGKRITRPGDDPVAAALSVRLRDQRAATGQFRRNIDQARVWFGAADGALGDAGNTLQRLRELTVQAANGTYSAQDRAAAGKEVTALYDQLLSVLNRTNGTGQHLFGGTQTTAPPFTTDADGNPVYNGDGGTITTQIGPDTSVALNLPGSAFTDLLSHVKRLATDFASGNVSTTALDDLDAGLNLVLTQRAEVGGQLNRLDPAEQHLTDQDLELSRLLSANEDADYAEALTRFTNQQAVYKAALEMGARVLPTSLLDFLR